MKKKIIVLSVAAAVSIGAAFLGVKLPDGSAECVAGTVAELVTAE